MTKAKSQSARAKPQVAVKVVSSPRDWLGHAKDWTVIVLAVSALGIAWRFAGDLFASGPLPVPSRAEVVTVAEGLQKLSTHVDAQVEITKGVIEQQRQDHADTLASRLRSLQQGLDAAKANFMKDPSLSNQRIVEALQSQLEGVQADIMKAATK